MLADAWSANQQNRTAMAPDPNANQPPRRPGQFTLQSILLLFIAVQVLLGLTVFLKHVGFVFSCFAIATGLGWRLRKWRLMASALTGLLVFLITYLACWVGMGYQSHMHSRMALFRRCDFDQIEDMLVGYADENGEFPESLTDLGDPEGFSSGNDEHGNVLDPWRHPYHYKKTTDGFELATLGRDGAFGGTGLDADIYFAKSRDPPESRLPPKQYLLEMQASAGVFLVAVFASLMAAFIWHANHWAFDRQRRSLILGILGTVVSAAVIAFFLASFHIAASQSGH